MARSRFQGKSQSSASRKSLWLPSCQIDELSDISRREVALSLSRTFPVERGSNAFKNRDGARRVAVLLGETPTAVHRRLQNFSSAAAAQLSSSTAETMRSRRSSSASSGSRSAAAGGAPPVAEEDADDSLDESVVRTVVQYAAHMSSGSASSSSAVGSASGHKSASAADSADGAQPAIGALLRAQWDGRLPTAASDPAQTSTVMSAPAVAASSAPSTAVEASSTATGSSCRPTDLLRQPRLQINNRVLKRLRDGRDLTYLGEQDTSESANAVQQPSASSTAGGYVTCGPCGSRRYVAVPSLCYKFGSWVCLHCIKFILKMLKNGSSSLKCLDQHGCAIGPSVSADPSDAGPAADPVDPESRCPACWLQRCLLALNFAEERHTRLRCCLPRALQSAVPPFSRKARCETGRCEPAPPPSLLPAVSAAVPVNGVAGGGAKLWSVPAAPGFEVISRTSAPQLPTSQTASVQPAVFSGEPPVVSSAEPLAVSSAEPLAASSAEPPLRRKTVVVVQLGDGWRRRETVRKGGRLDRVVCSPGGMRFKSVVELQAHLRSSGCPPSSAKDYFFREATAAVKQKTPLTDQAPRNSCAKRGPRVKLVCRSASVALGQPRATFADLHADVAPVPQLAPAQSSLPPSPPSTPPPPAQPDREEEEDSATPQPSGSAAVASTSPASRDSRTRLRRKRRRKLVVEDRGSRNIRLKLKVLNKYKHLKSARAATGLKSARAGAGLKPGSGRVRMSRCRACAGCRSKNCRQCVFCHDMVKYGGPGKLKKSCVARTCKRPLLPGVSELKFQTSAAGGSDAVDAVKPRGCRGRAPGTSAVRRTPSALYKSRLHRPLLHPLGQQGVRKRLAFRKRAAGVRQLHRPQTDGLDEAAGEDDAADTSSVLLDTWLPEDLGEIWRHGLAVVLTEPLEVPLLCFICGSHGSEELVFCNSCCEPFHAFCLDECEVPVTAGQLDSWLCRRCQLCAICGCPAADDDQLLARCRQCNDTFHRACGDPHSCVDDAKLADRQPWMYVGWPQQPAPPHALPVTPPPSPLPLHTAASPLPPPSFQSLYCPWCPDDLPKVTSLPLQAPPVQASVVDEQSGQKSVVVDSADESAPFLGFPADELRLSKPVAQVECVEKVPEVVEVKRKSVTKKTTSDVVRRSSRSTRGRHSWKERDSASAAVAAAEPEKSTEPPAPVESESMQPDVAAEGQEDVVEPAAVTGPAVLTSAPPTTPELKSHMVVVSVPVEWRFITQHEALQMVYAGMSCLPPSSGDQLERFGLQYRLETAAVGVRPLLQRLDRDVDRQLQRLGYPPSQQRLRRRRHSSGVSVEQLPRLVAGRDRQRHGSGPPIPLERCGFSEQDWLYWRSLLPRRIGRPRKYPRQNDLDMIAVLQQTCGGCTRCRSCRRAEIHKYVGNLPLCSQCYQLHQGGNLFPQSGDVHSQHAQLDMVMECESCHTWVHAGCERLSSEQYETLRHLPAVVSYLCDRCLPEPPAVTTVAPLRDVSWKYAVREELVRGCLSLVRCVWRLVSSASGWEEEERRLQMMDAELRMGGEAELPSVAGCDDRLAAVLHRMCSVDSVAGVDAWRRYKLTMRRRFPWYGACDVARGGEVDRVDGSTESAVPVPPSVTPTSPQRRRPTAAAGGAADWPRRLAELCGRQYRSLRALESGRTPHRRRCRICGHTDDHTSVATRRQCGRLVWAGGGEWLHAACLLLTGRDQPKIDVDGSVWVNPVSSPSPCCICRRAGASLSCADHTHNTAAPCLNAVHLPCVLLQDAAADGWMLTVAGLAFCPQHRPAESLPSYRPAALLHRRLMVDLECRRRRSATSVPMNSVSVVIGSLTVHKLGKQVVACAGSCLLVPVEMVCSRVYWSTVNPRRRTVYTVRVTSTLTSTTRSTTSLLLHHTVDHGLPKQQLEEALALLEKWHESTADAAVGPGDERVNEVAAPSSVVAPGSVVALGSVVAPGFVVAPGSGEVSHRHQPGVLLMSDGTRQTSSSSAVAGDRLVTAAADSQSDGVLTGSGGSTGVSSAADDQRDAEVRACVDTLVSHVCRSVVEEEEETLLADANLNIPILESMDNDFLTLMLNELCEGEAAASSTGPAASPSAPSPSNNSTAASPEQAAPSIADSSDVTAPLESPTTPSVVQPQAGPGVQLQQDARRSSAPMCDVIRGTSAPLLVTPEPTRGGPSSEYFGRMMFSTGGVAEHQLTRAAFSGGDHQSAFRPAGRRSSTGSVAPPAAPTAAANEQQAAVVKPMAAVMPEPREQLLATSWGYNPHAHHQMYSAAAAQMGYYHHHHHRSPPPPYPQHHMQPPAAPQLLYPHHWAVPQQASAAGGWGCPPHQSTSGQQLWPTAQTGVGGAAKPTEQLQYQHQDWTGQRLWQLDGAGDEEYARPLDDNSPAKCPRCRRLYRTRPSMLRHSATCTMDVDTSSGDESADEDVAPHQQQPVELGETEVSSTTAPSVAAVEVKQEPADSSPVPVAVHHQPPQPVHHRAPIQPSAGSSSGAGKVSRRRSPKKRVAPYLVVPPEPRPHVAAAVPAPLPAIHMPQPQWVMLGNGQLLQLPPVSAAPQQLQQSNVLMMPSPAYTLMAAPMPQQQQPHHQQAGFMYPTLMGLPQGASVQHLGSFELNSPLVYSLPLASAPPPLQAPQQVGPPIVVPTAPSPVQSCLVDSSRPLSTEPAIPTSAQMMFQSPSPAAVSSPRPSTSARGDSPPIFHPPSVPPPPATVAVVNLCQPSPTDSPMERHVVAPAAPPPPPLVRQSSLYVQPPPPQPYVRQRVQQHALQQHQSQPATPQLPASVVQSVLDAISTVAQPMPSRFILSDSRQHPHQPEISRSTAADSRQCQHQPEVSRSIAADDAPSATTGVNNAIKSRLNVSQTADDSSGGCNTNIKDIRKVAKIKPRPTYSYRDAMKTSSTLPADRVICRLVQRDGGTLLSAGTSSGSAVPHRSSVLAAASTPSSAVVAASTPSSSAVVAASTPSSSAVVAASIPSSSGAVAGPIQGTSKMSYRIKLRRDPHHQLGYQVRDVVQHGGVDCGANAGVLPPGAAVRSVCITARMGPNDQSTSSTAGAGCSGQSVVARATSQSRQLNAESRTSSSATFSPTRQQFRQPASGAHIPAPAGEDSDKENSGHRVGIDGATVAPPLDADITPGVVYEITSADGFKFRSSHASDIWRSVFDAVQEARAGLKMRPLSYNKTALNGHQMLGLTHSVVQALLEQMPGTENCTQHQFRFRDQRVVRQSSPPLEGSRLGCARAEGFSGPRKRLDLFGWLASTHRLPPEPTSPTPAVSSGAVSAASTVSSKCWRRSASLELPVAMRYRQLCDTYRRQVGVYRSRISGRGLFCRRAVEPGEMVIEYFGEVIRASLADVRERRYGTRGIGCYMFRIDDDWVVDATKCGNGARFINHSCNPNCYSRVVDVLGQKRIIIFALRPICRGEELTYDYKFPIEEDKIPCHCGARRCRKYLN